jgi:hypothetical protein
MIGPWRELPAAAPDGSLPTPAAWIRGGVLIRIVRPSMAAPQRIQSLRSQAVRHDERSREPAPIRQARLDRQAAGGA